jgi:hypothetical protein
MVFDGFNGNVVAIGFSKSNKVDNIEIPKLFLGRITKNMIFEMGNFNDVFYKWFLQLLRMVQLKYLILKG